MRLVTLGRAVGRESVVAKGIAPGDTVVTDGQLRLGPGFPVEIVSAGSGAAEGKAAGASQ
jgi:multidrug efflux pump subunit AcrA (membrane-fusion protein)